MDSYVAYFSRPETVLELLKTVLQLVGAVIIAKLTVKWALGRFKTEKFWERRVGAMADVMSSLREMLRVLAIWEAWEIEKIEPSDETRIAVRERWKSAERKFESVSAIAILVLPQSAADRIERLEAGLKEENETWFDEVEGNTLQISAALTWLIDHAKEYRA